MLNIKIIITLSVIPIRYTQAISKLEVNRRMNNVMSFRTKIIIEMLKIVQLKTIMTSKHCLRFDNSLVMAIKPRTSINDDHLFWALCTRLTKRP